MEIKSTFTGRNGQVYDYIYREGFDPMKDLEGKILQAVHGVCFYGDKIVIVYAKEKGYWSLPGGSIEPGETYEQAVIREIKEETNMKVLHQELVGYIDIYEKDRIVRQTRSLCIVEPYGDFVSDLDGDITEIKLIDPKDIKEYFDWLKIGERIMERALELNNARLKIKKVKSFGIIPIFKNNDGYKLLIVQNSKGEHWGLPKGTPENNEKPIETAKRELFEETGIKDVEIKLEQTFSENYSFEMNGINYNKTNLYYICFVDQMIVGNNLDEINEARWVSFEDARKIMTHDSVIGIVNELEKYLSRKIQ